MAEKSNELKDRISQLPDESLLEMVQEKFADYREEAINYAKEALDARGIPFSEHTSDEDNIQAKTIEAPDGKRFINFVLDQLALIIILLILTFSFGASVWPFMGLVGILYYFSFETVFQKTPAKFITHTKVVMRDGSKPDIATIMRRTLIRLVPFEPLSGRREEGWWHDRWTGTMVIEN